MFITATANYRRLRRCRNVQLRSKYNLVVFSVPSSIFLFRVVGGSS